MVIIDSITESRPYSLTQIGNMRNLQNMPKRRKNTTENFAPVGEKAVKNLDVVKAVPKQFPKPSAQGQSQVLPYVLTGLLTLGSVFPAFNNNARAAEPTEEGKLALNQPRAEGSNTTASAALKAPEEKPLQRAPIPRSKGHFRTSDLTKETSRNVLRDAPYEASDDRISLALYGENEAIEGAVMGAGKLFSERIHDVSLLVFRDEDSDSNSLILGVYADGREKYKITIPVPAGLEDPAALKSFQTTVVRTVYKAMYDAYRIEVRPHLAPEKDPPLQDLAKN